MIRKRKGAKRPNPFEKMKKLLPELDRKDILSVFEYNLDPEIPGKTVDGLVAVSREDVIVFLDDVEVQRIKLSDIASFKTDNGVGTIFVSYELKSDSSVHLLCIGDMKCSRRAIGTVKRINRVLEFGLDYYDKIMARRPHGDDNAPHGGRGVCEKCGRPIPRGTNQCPRCSKNKLKNILRLWNIIKPYKWFVILSVVLFIVVSGLNLISPEINKIVTDDFINSKEPQNVVA